jgi:hypothetical protein
MHMTRAEKSRIVIYNNGIEFSINVQGGENYMKTVAFLRDLSKNASDDNVSTAAKHPEYFALEDQQIAALQAFMKESLNN